MRRKNPILIDQDISFSSGISMDFFQFEDLLNDPFKG